MAKQNFTKKQILLQTIPQICVMLITGILYIIGGISGKNNTLTIFGIVFIALAIGFAIYWYIRWKRNPHVNEQLDEQIATEFKDGTKGFGMAIGIIAICLLAALSLLFILK